MFERRLRILSYLFCAALAVIVGRALHLQVLGGLGRDPDAILVRRDPFVEIPSFRGAILDRNGEVLAADRPVLDLAIRYPQLCEPDLWLVQVCRATGLGREEVLRVQRAVVRRVSDIRAMVPSRIRRIYEETIPHTLVPDISVDTAALVEARPDLFPGAVIRTGTRRFHPHGPLAAHVVGYLGRARAREDPAVRPGDRVGVAGVEKQYERLLRAVPGVARLERDRSTGARRRVVLFPASPGRSLFLTLDAAAQERAEQALGGRTGAVVVMDVHSGELLVLASSPAFDPDDPGAALRNPSGRPFVSRAIQDSVPSGSVVKPLVALAAAIHGRAGPGTTFECDGSMELGGHVFHCYAKAGHGRVDMATAIEQSCNVYFYKLGLKVGAEAIVETLRRMGFGRRTGVDLPYEWPGFVPDPAATRAAGRRWYPGDTVVLSIGQGSLRVTPLQVAVAMAAIANGGKVLRPRVFLRAEPEPDPESRPEAGPVVVRTLSLPPEALEAVREGMRRAVLSGTARRIVRLRELKVAAKTGTAETRDPELNHAWLAGFVPWDEPRYAFAVVVHDVPGHGAEVAGPVAAAVLEELLARSRELASTQP